MVDFTRRQPLASMVVRNRAEAMKKETPVSSTKLGQGGATLFTHPADRTPSTGQGLTLRRSENSTRQGKLKHFYFYVLAWAVSSPKFWVLVVSEIIATLYWISCTFVILSPLKTSRSPVRHLHEAFTSASSKKKRLFESTSRHQVQNTLPIIRRFVKSNLDGRRRRPL